MKTISSSSPIKDSQRGKGERLEKEIRGEERRPMVEEGEIDAGERGTNPRGFWSLFKL